MKRINRGRSPRGLYREWLWVIYANSVDYLAWFSVSRQGLGLEGQEDLVSRIISKITEAVIRLVQLQICIYIYLLSPPERRSRPPLVLTTLNPKPETQNP